MKNSIQSIPSFEWEINETQDQQKKIISLLEKFFFVFILIIFIFPPLGFFMIIIAIIMFVNLKQSADMKQKEGVILEKYKIDDRGITIDNLKESKKSFFPWSELISFYSYAKTNPLLSFIRNKVAGDDFVVVDKNNKRIELRAGINNTSKVRSMLSGKLKFKTPTNTQASFSSSNSPFKIKYSEIGLFNNWLKTPSSSNNNKQNNVGFVNSKQEKQFHEQTIVQRRNLQRGKDKFKNKIIIISYIIVMFIVTSLYLMYKYKDPIVDLNSNQNRNKIENSTINENEKSEASPQKNDLNSVNKSNNELLEDKEWPKDKKTIVQCTSDSDCELYFYFKIEPGEPIPTEITFNNYVNITRDSYGCIWGVINKKYKSIWWKRYPLSDNCDISITKEKQVTCNKYSKTCALY